MGLEWEQIWALALIPIGIAVAIWIDRRYGLTKRSLRRRVTLIARCILLCTIALAVAAPSVLLASGGVLRWVVMDVSDSTRQTRTAMQQTVAQALSALPGGQQAGVIAFGAQALVDTPMQAQPAFTGLHTQVDGRQTDLDGALRFAAALLPSGNAGGLTLVTDGKGTVSEKTIAMLAQRGVKVDALLAATPEGADAQVTQLVAPAESYEGQRIPLRVTVDANAAMEATLVLSQNGTVTATRKVSLEKGQNRFAFSDMAQKTGVIVYEARLMATADTQPANNVAAVYVRVKGAPNLLLVGNGGGVERLFLSSGMRVQNITPAELPQTADGYLSCDAVLLNNVSYNTATEQQWQALDQAVRTLGRGLVVLGGDASYALGGYRGTTLEKLLPVRIDVKEKMRAPALALMLVIDKSGSMTAGQFGSTRIEVAKEASMSAVEVLSEKDFIGVIGFDDAAKWVVPFQNVTDVTAIQGQIGTMRADGGTAFYAALDEAYRTLAAASAPQKHVILLSDGEPGDSGFEEIALAMQKSGITMTTVAVGDGADQSRMRLLATLGGGRSYCVGEFDDVPKIFTKETMMVSGNYVQNRTFMPVVTEQSSLTHFEGFPALDGYLTTAEKPTATVSMMSDTDEPLLAWWHADAGIVVAWTSDAQGAWTKPYLAWQETPAFFAGMVAKALPGTARDGIVEGRISGDSLQITYTCSEETALKTTVDVVVPNGTQQTLAMPETAPGVYTAQMKAEDEGAYVMRVSQTNRAGETRLCEGGAVRGFSGEYDLRIQPDGSVERLCEATDGRILVPGGAFWQTELSPSVTRRKLQNMLCVVALLLLLADIALRKLPWEEWLPKRLGSAQPVKQQPKPKVKKETRTNPNKIRHQAAQQTADALLSAKQTRKHL